MMARSCENPSVLSRHVLGDILCQHDIIAHLFEMQGAADVDEQLALPPNGREQAAIRARHAHCSHRKATDMFEIRLSDACLNEKVAVGVAFPITEVVAARGDCNASNMRRRAILTLIKLKQAP